MSNSIKALLHELKDTMDDPETVEKESKPKPKKKQADPSMPFSDKELAELNRELLHHDTAYKEPLPQSYKLKRESKRYHYQHIMICL